MQAIVVQSTSGRRLDRFCRLKRLELLTHHPVLNVGDLRSAENYDGKVFDAVVVASIQTSVGLPDPATTHCTVNCSTLLDTLPLAVALSLLYDE